MRPRRPTARFPLEQLRCTAPVLGRGVCAVGLFAFVSGFVGAIDPPENDVLMQWITLGVSAAVVATCRCPLCCSNSL